ncbi:SRPBCC family protein [Mycobacterium sp.]|uniref:SRPBCC family protein n=1 Tax=Mycobacterium sp. TaxID=1785 RepID=UPI003D1206F6
MTVNIVDTGPRRISRSVEVAAPAEELYAMAADPRRHHELDGSGTVLANITMPEELSVGSKFSTHMKVLGVPYRITSTVTALEPNELVEWRHPVGHHWRWQFHALSPTTTRVTETFDYHDAGPIKNAIGYYHLIGATKFNVTGIESTLEKLQNRYAAR